MKAKILIIILLLIFIMTGIVHERIVASRDKGLAVDWNADHEITGDVDMDQHSWLNQVIENRTDWPAGPVEGQIVWRSDLKNFYIFDGTKWEICMLKTKTSYWHTEGLSFVPDSPKLFNFAYDFQTAELHVITSAGEDMALCPVSLPHGAIVTHAVVYGSDVGADWYLYRDDDGTIMATAKINTEDNTIANATIDNQNHSYFFQVEVGNDDWVSRARITYTTIYI